MSNVPEREIVLVTGTSKGIGRYLAEHFINRGDIVYGCSRSNASVQHSHYTHFKTDVTDEAAVRAIVQSIRKTHGRLDILINNAGVAAMNLALLTPTETVEKILKVNVLGTFIVCREAARLMQRNRYGRIVNLGSVAVPMRIEGEAAYAASKSAVVTLSHILARELAPFNITVNVVAPTPTDTDLLKGIPAEKIDDIVGRQAIKRLGRCEDVAYAIDFFVGRQSSYITGQILYLGGV